MKVEVEQASLPAVGANGTQADPLLIRLESFFSSPDFTSAVGTFMGSSGPKVQLRATEDEQPLENFEAYRKYTELLETTLGAFLEKEGIREEDLFNRCREAKSSGDAGWAMSLDYLLASTEYDAFLQLVEDFRGMQQWAGEGDEALEWDLGDDETSTAEAGG